LDLHRSFYKYSLKFIEWDEAATKEAEEIQQKRRTVEKYGQLMRTSLATDGVEEKLNLLLAEACRKLGPYPNRLRAQLSNRSIGVQIRELGRGRSR
jgi:hypothetical protein